MWGNSGGRNNGEVAEGYHLRLSDLVIPESLLLFFSFFSGDSSPSSSSSWLSTSCSSNLIAVFLLSMSFVIVSRLVWIWARKRNQREIDNKKKWKWKGNTNIRLLPLELLLLLLHHPLEFGLEFLLVPFGLLLPREPLRRQSFVEVIVRLHWRVADTARLEAAAAELLKNQLGLLFQILKPIPGRSRHVRGQKKQVSRVERKNYLMSSSLILVKSQCSGSST